jgi:triacylglycerol lipase
MRHRLLLPLLVMLMAGSRAHADCVILLHGLARTSRAMEQMADGLLAHGYQIANIDYPSRRHPVEELAPEAIEAGLNRCGEQRTVHFVTHSLGGILVRHYLQHHTLPNLGRVVMLGPPNHGSEVVDKMRHVPGFAWYNGPAGLQLGTDAESVPNQLPAVTYPVGVIAGTATINMMLSQLLPNPDDGKVSVASARVEGMLDFITVPYSHPFLMQRDEVINLTARFLQSGSFDAQSAE